MPEQAPRSGVTALYLALTQALDRRIRAIGWTMERVDQVSGNADGYCAKALHPLAPSGRQAKWETFQNILDSVYPDGLQVTLKANPVTSAKHASRLSKKTLADRGGHSSRKMDIAELARQGGLASVAARQLKHTPEQRARIARKAARARARSLTPQERSEIARDAARARWDAVKQNAQAQAMT